MLIAYNTRDDPGLGASGGKDSDTATDNMIDEICYDYNHYKPCMYRRNARRDYLNLAKYKKRTVLKQVFEQ